MVTIDDATAILFVFQAIILMVTTAFLFYSGLKKKMSNLVVLAIAFLFTLSAIIAVIAGQTFDDMQNLYNVGLIILAVFVYLTFYRKQHSGYRITLLLMFIFYIVKVLSYNVYEEEGYWLYIDTLSQTFLVVLPLNYYGKASLRAYREMKDKQLQPHVKIRLRIMGYVSYITLVGNLPIWILEVVTGTTYDQLPFGSALVVFLVTVTSFIFSVGMFLSWVMPDWFKSYLNRDYEGFQISDPVSEELTEFSEEEQAEIMEQGDSSTSTVKMITFLGSQLQVTSNVDPLVSRGLIRFAVKDKYGEVPQQILFKDWILIIDDYLVKRLSRMVPDPTAVCDDLKAHLIQNQSVITMVSI